MKNKVVLYIAMSLDGYIARPDGSVDWLFDVEGDGGDNGYSKFYDTIGTVVMGRLTNDEILTLSEEFMYAGKPCYVLSRTKQADRDQVTFTDESLDTLIPKLQNASSGDVWIVGGGQIVKECLAKGLLEDIIITIIPKVLGSGIPLFPEGTVPSTFKLYHSEVMGQMVSLYYQGHS